MPGILSRYALREVVYPAILALVALTFIILIVAKAPWVSGERLLFTLMKLFFREETSKAEVVQIFFLGLPTILMFIAPMAFLVGIIIGVGRMTLDLEVRSIQTGGLHLMRVFFPIILFGGGMSVFAGWMSYELEPRMVEASIRRGGRLLISEFTNLEPGRVYDELFADQSGMHLYFAEREPEHGGMKGVSVMLERKSVQSEEEKEEEKGKRKAEVKRIENLIEEGTLTQEDGERLIYQIEKGDSDELPVMLFAERAAFDIDPIEAKVEFRMENGSIHMLEATKRDGGSPRGAVSKNPEYRAKAEAEGKELPPAEEVEAPDDDAATTDSAALIANADETDEGDYAIITFGQLKKTEIIGESERGRGQRIMTIPQLMSMMKSDDLDKDMRLDAKAAICERISRAFESLLFAFIGLPLAVWIKPTGKSIGILLAAIVIFAYHLLMRTGYSMIVDEKSLGMLVIFAPNILCAILGGFLWHRAIRS